MEDEARTGARDALVERLWRLLGGRPAAGELEADWSAEREQSDTVDGARVAWLRSDVSFTAEPGVRVPALLLRPAVAAPGPAVLYLHSHSGDYSRGREEALLGKRKVLRGIAPRLVAAGCSVLAADFRCFGDRAGENERESARRHLLAGTTLWGGMLWDQLRALDLLAALPFVDPARIGCFGFSMGSTAGWWLSALERRIAAGVGLCCLSSYRVMARRGVLHRHGIYYFVPGAATVGVPAILSLIAPRPFLFVNGDRDEASPAEGARDAVDRAAAACREQGTEPRFRLELLEGLGHETSEPMIRRSVDWLAGELGALRGGSPPRS